jgi:protein ImuB
MLWLCLHLPRLPLDVFSRGGPASGPQAVVEPGRTSAQRILLCNDKAACRGVRPGMAVAAAQALLDDLQLVPRDPSRERIALEQLAAWAMRYTSVVSLAPPQALLLEIGGSLSLFGGLERLQAQVHDELQGLGYGIATAVAPTPLAALWLARHQGDAVVVEHKRALTQVLAAIPLARLELDRGLQKSLRGMGLRVLGDLLRLPRDGLARRLGKDLLQDLDRALGRLPDPRTPFVPPACFHEQLALPAEVEEVEALLFAVQRLVSGLAGRLQGCGGGVQQLELRLMHRHQRVTSVSINLAAPARDGARMLALVRERLEHSSLVAPVLEVALLAERILPFAESNRDLFARRGEQEEDWTALLERLHARLGEEAVRGLYAVAEHRPERAWCDDVPGQTRTVPRFAPRPIWLLPVPLPLEARGNRPHFHGALELEPGRERIESGWWDGNDVARDYFVARNPHGVRLWLFRELRGSRGWYLHGIFG